LYKKFKSSHKFVSYKDDITSSRLQNVKAVVLPAPQQDLTPQEVETLCQYMRRGGRVAVFAAEAGDPSFAHLNTLTEQYGICVQENAVIRTCFHKSFPHPKAAFIGDAATSDALTVLAGLEPASSAPHLAMGEEQGLSVVYPHGCTLTVTSPAVPLLTSGTFSLPAAACIAAAAPVGEGLLVVVGSPHMLDDAYLDKARNSAWATALLALLTGDSPLKLNGAVVNGPPEGLSERDACADLSVDTEAPEFAAEVRTVPDTEALAERLRPCLQEPEELPTDFRELFDVSLTRLSTTSIGAVKDTYARMGVPKRALSLIRPVFEVPLPQLQPAVLMPLLVEPPPPELELFDLDEHFASAKLKLAQLANRCRPTDVGYFAEEAAHITGASNEVRASRTGEDKLKRVTAAEALLHMLQTITQYKRLDGGRH
jgi:intraflagellar transport protein 52